MKTKLCGFYGFYFFYQIEKMNYFNTILKKCFEYLKLSIIVFGKSSNNSENKKDTSLSAQKPYLRTNHLESNIEENINKENQYRTKNLKHPISIREADSKIFIDTLFSDPSILKNNTHVVFIDENLHNVRLVRVNSLPAINQPLTPKQYVDDAIDELYLVRNNQDNDFNNHILTNINSNTLDTQAVNDNQVNTESYVDQFHQENERSRRDLG